MRGEERKRLQSARRLPWLALVLLAACFRQPMPDLSDLPDQPQVFPVDRYRGLAAEGWSVLEVDQQRSLVRIYVYRAGKMERLGHNHVVSASDVGGLAAMKDGEIRADLYLPVARLVVDDAELRAGAGEEFQSDLSEEDKQDTRANMLSEKVLHARQYPFLQAGLSFTNFREGENDLQAGIHILDERKGIRIPVTIEQDDGLRAAGRFSLKQSQFGIEPFSIMGGAVAVADEVEVEFELVFLPPQKE